MNELRYNFVALRGAEDYYAMLRRLGKPVCGPIDDPGQLIDLPPLDVGEARLDPANGVRLLGGDALAELALALA